MLTVPTDLLKNPNILPMSNKEDSPREDFFGSGRELIIEPGRTEQRYWRELWKYRELFQDSLRADGLCWSATLEFVCHGAERCFEQPNR